MHQKNKEICYSLWLHRHDFNVLSATRGGVSIISFTSIVGAPVGIASTSFTLIFSLTTGIIRKLISTARNNKKKHDKILMLAKSKLKSLKL